MEKEFIVIKGMKLIFVTTELLVMVLGGFCFCFFFLSHVTAALKGQF